MGNCFFLFLWCNLRPFVLFVKTVILHAEDCSNYVIGYAHCVLPSVNIAFVFRQLSVFREWVISFKFLVTLTIWLKGTGNHLIREEIIRRNRKCACLFYFFYYSSIFNSTWGFCSLRYKWLTCDVEIHSDFNHGNYTLLVTLQRIIK